MGSVPKTIPGLIERFCRNVDAYRAGRYNETQIRREFIDPLFTALGWDVDNRAGHAEAYKDVIHEDAIKVGGRTKAPDYCFRIGGARKFFVEAKKPSVDIAHDVHPAYQLRRYAWSAKLPLSILTDFEELAVYDCRVRPKRTDKAAVARTIYLTYDQYADKWDDIAAIFAKEAILQGSFDKYVVGRKKRGTAEVDAEFLKEIEKWRGALARNIALRNERLNVREINFAVQRTIDRIIFLRMAEDRGVEEYATLQALINGTDVYGRLMQMFRAADDRYNSGLFHFNDESGRDQPPDTLTPGLNIDDKVLKDIFRGLYYPDSPYEFSVLPADILGNVYEQFLGKVIHLTPGHQARVEEKPEVKKAGGVYYTPKYIVDYIVKHTVGRLITGQAGDLPGSQEPGGGIRESRSPVRAEDGSPGREAGEQVTPKPGAPKGRKKSAPNPLTPRQISRLRILDPACGSGSFLVGAYKFLLDYHRDWYVNDSREHPEHRQQNTRYVYQGAGGQWYLTTAVKKKILLNNIYGVDIDSQAVEVTKLNLLLCVLENENQGTVGQMALIHERILPDLSDNIKCGNSLIGPDFYEGKQLSLFDEEARYRINAFDWQAEFPQVFKGKNPGFDAVIGNPPWGSKAVLAKDEVSFLGGAYNRQTQNMNIFALFIDLAIYRLLWAKGIMGLLVPKNFTKTESYLLYRKDMLTQASLQMVTDFGKFPQVAQEAVAVFAAAEPSAGRVIRRIDHLGRYPVELPVLSPEDVLADPFVVVSLSRRGNLSGIVRKVRDWSLPLSDEFRLIRGLEHGRKGSLLFCRSCGKHFEKPGKHHKPLKTVDCKYCGAPIVMNNPESNVSFITKYRSDDKCRGLLVGNSIDRYALREVSFYGRSGLKGVDYKGLEDIPEKLLFIRISATLRGYLDSDRLLCLNALNVVYPERPTAYSLRYVLGILNSRLFVSYADFAITGGAKLTMRLSNSIMRSLPVRKINFSDGEDKAKHDQMVNLVDRILELHKALPLAKTDHDKALLKRQIATTDRQIDELVYELYDLTEEEIATVEEVGP